MARIYTYIPILPDQLKALLASIIAEEFLKHKLIQLPDLPKDEYLNVADVAAIISRNRGRVYAYTRAGLITAYKLNGVRGLKYKKHEIEAAISKLDLSSNIKTKPSGL